MRIAKYKKASSLRRARWRLWFLRNHDNIHTGESTPDFVATSRHHREARATVAVDIGRMISPPPIRRLLMPKLLAHVRPMERWRLRESAMRHAQDAASRVEKIRGAPIAAHTRRKPFDEYARRRSSPLSTRQNEVWPREE